MALLKGKLFAGALFAGALLNPSSEVITPPEVSQVTRVQQGTAGGIGRFEGGQSLIRKGHTWIEVHRVARYGVEATPVTFETLAQAEGTAGWCGVFGPSVGAEVQLTLDLPLVEEGSKSLPVQVSLSREAEVGVAKLEAGTPQIFYQYLDEDELFALLVA